MTFARRLQTVMERMLDEISFTATDRAGKTMMIDTAFVQPPVGDRARTPISPGCRPRQPHAARRRSERG